MNNGRTVVKPPSITVLIGPDRAHYCRYTLSRRYDRLKRIKRRRDNIGILKPVLRRISMRHYLRKDNDVRPVTAPFFDRLNYLLSIPNKIAVGSVYLCNGDFHLALRLFCE